MAGLRSIEGLFGTATEESPDLDNVASFNMSSASAEQVTLQIRSMMERAWEYIAIAYQGRAHLALGYESWDEYVDDRLGDLRLTVPRQERGAVVQSLSKAHMSLRAIARVLGVSVATAYRDAASEVDGHPPDDGTARVQGRDGRQYRRRRKAACTICGEVHDEPSDECPWDLFAQGRGPRPSSIPDSLEMNPAIQQSSGEASGEQMSPNQPKTTSSVVDALTRAVCILDELDVLPELVDEIGAAIDSCRSIQRDDCLATSIHELMHRLRMYSEAMARLLDRLDRLERAE